MSEEHVIFERQQHEARMAREAQIAEEQARAAEVKARADAAEAEAIKAKMNQSRYGR